MVSGVSFVTMSSKQNSQRLAVDEGVVLSLVVICLEARLAAAGGRADLSRGLVKRDPGTGRLMMRVETL